MHKFLVVILLALITGASLADEKISPKTIAILCADQSDNRIRLIDPRAKDGQKATLWAYPAENQEQIKYMPTDAKRMVWKGEVCILAAYHGRVKMIRLSDHKVLVDYPSLGSCHSAELLPDGVIVTANSNHAKLRIHRSAEDFEDLDLPYAHGVCWDKKRKLLWALGDQLYSYKYAKGKLSLVQKYPLPDSPTGHDLFPTRDGNNLLVTNNDALYTFDLKTAKFKKLSALKEIKSVSEHQDGSIWISDPKNLKGASSWQSNTLMNLENGDAKKQYLLEGTKFYKARWWQSVTFSYE